MELSILVRAGRMLRKSRAARLHTARIEVERPARARDALMKRV